MNSRARIALALVACGAAARAQEPAGVAPSPRAPEAVVETGHGSFVIRLLPDLAPRHVEHFVATARKGGYDGTTFHRIIPRGIVQGGDPISKDPARTAAYGTGGLGLLKAEFSERPMTRGSVAAVLRPRQKDSGGNQFFVCLSDQAQLTGQYTIFGEVSEGMDVVDKVGEAPVSGDRATQRVEIRKVTIR
jgi:peptidyl-prolyl cis-trans isomerase B (cyclophilin B)